MDVSYIILLPTCLCCITVDSKRANRSVDTNLCLWLIRAKIASWHCKFECSARILDSMALKSIWELALAAIESSRGISVLRSSSSVELTAEALSSLRRAGLENSLWYSAVRLCRVFVCDECPCAKEVERSKEEDMNSFPKCLRLRGVAGPTKMHEQWEMEHQLNLRKEKIC